MANPNCRDGRVVRRRRDRRSEGFAVRQWLQVGVASAGMGAALLGFSLMGPQVGVAAADSSEGTSASAGPSGGDPSGSRGSARRQDRDGHSSSPDRDSDEHTDADEQAARSSGNQKDAEVGDDRDLDKDGADTKDRDADVEVSDKAVAAERESASAQGSSAEGDAGKSARGTDVAAEAVAKPSVVERGLRRSIASKAVAVEPEPASTTSELVQSGREQRVAQVLDGWTAAHDLRISSLSVPDKRKARLEASFLAMRRTLFNQAPTVAPVQISGVITGPIVGTLGGADPDGDKLIYLLTKAPGEGTVRFGRDGSFTYTPGENFDGVDTFTVKAIDLGLHINLLQPLRPLGSRPATSLINQGAIKFDFTYSGGIQNWTLARIAAFEDEANRLVPYLRVTTPVVLTYDVRAFEDRDTDVLAYGGSNPISSDPGYWPTVVQNKLLTGVDSNGSAVDGRLTWNWGQPWALGDPVGSDETDFASTLLHELMHTLGFLSHVSEPGDNSFTDWSVFDRFVVTVDGMKPINSDFTWNSQYDPNVLGQNGGMYFGGANAVAAYGGPVPLYTYDPWDGSNMSHLNDDVFGSNTQMMTAFKDDGAILRTLSPIEIGILKDLGYLVVPLPPSA